MLQPSGTKSSTGLGHVPELDGIRGLAVLLVLVFHYVFLALPGAREGQSSLLRRSMSLTWSGVDLFFVLSGFLIGGILIAQRDAPHLFKTFYLRRAARILPLYAFVLLLAFAWKAGVAAGVLKAHHWFTDEAYFPFWSYLTFTQNFFMSEANTYGTTWLSCTWSLAIEEQFYLVLPLVVWLTPVRKLPAVLIPMIVAAPVIRLFLFEFHENQGYPAHVLMPARADTLLLGVLGAWALGHEGVRRVLKENVASLYALLVLLLAGAGALSMRGAGVGGFRMGFLGVSWLALLYLCVIVLAVVESRGPVSFVARLPPLRALGRISYAVYLFHYPIGGLAHGYLTGDEPWLRNGHDAAVMILALALTLALSWASWVLFERRLLVWGQTFTYDGTGRRPATRPAPEPDATDLLPAPAFLATLRARGV